jgi:hypothetical protein
VRRGDLLSLSHSADLNEGLSTILLFAGGAPPREPDELPFRAIQLFVFPVTDIIWYGEFHTPYDDDSAYWDLRQMVNDYEGGQPGPGEPDEFCHLLFNHVYPNVCPNNPPAADNSVRFLGCIGQVVAPRLAPYNRVAARFAYDYCASREGDLGTRRQCEDNYRAALMLFE